MNGDDRELARAQELMTSPFRSKRLQGFRACAAVLIRRHQLDVTWRDGRATASMQGRHITCPPIVDAATFATFLHETGHALNGPCRGDLHRRDVRVTQTWACLHCEERAWWTALTLAPFSKLMVRRLQASLATYRIRTPAPRQVLAAADALLSERTYYTATIQRWRREIRDAQLDRVRRVELELQQQRATYSTRR
jgi:hypothetical protein